MNFFASYKQSMKLVLAIVAAIILSFCVYAWNFYDNGVVDYKPWRDKDAVKKIFHDDWQWLQYGDWGTITEDDFDVDFMLDNRSSSQYSAHSNLILKVYRDAGKTVGFLAYYPKSAYAYQMLFLIVDKDHRGKGYASKLIQYFMDDSIARGAVKLLTFTRVANSRARSLYEGKFGFKATPYVHDDKYIDLTFYPKKNK